MLQEEVRKLHIALSEERKVTEKLSRNLELEKRRSESLEQKAKNAFRKSSQANTSNTAVFLPEEMRYRDEQLADKMEKYTDQIERVTMSLQECEEKLTGFEIQVNISSSVARYGALREGLALKKGPLAPFLALSVYFCGFTVLKSAVLIVFTTLENWIL